MSFASAKLSSPKTWLLDEATELGIQASFSAFFVCRWFRLRLFSEELEDDLLIDSADRFEDRDPPPSLPMLSWAMLSSSLDKLRFIAFTKSRGKISVVEIANESSKLLHSSNSSIPAQRFCSSVSAGSGALHADPLGEGGLFTRLLDLLLGVFRGLSTSNGVFQVSGVLRACGL